MSPPPLSPLPAHPPAPGGGGPPLKHSVPGGYQSCCCCYCILLVNEACTMAARSSETNQCEETATATTYGVSNVCRVLDRAMARRVLLVLQARSWAAAAWSAQRHHVALSGLQHQVGRRSPPPPLHGQGRCVAPCTHHLGNTLQ
jgi:hypothetical protein